MLVDTGEGGWAWFSLWGAEEAEARVRFAVRPDGRLEAAELHLGGPVPITGDLLRNLPLAGMEAWANGRGREGLMAAIESAGVEVEQATDEWRRSVADGWATLGTRARRPSLRLRIPNGPKRPDSFYKRVGEVYSALAVESHRPAKEIADANGVKPTTVHRWIKEARARGVLGPGQRGRAG